GGVAVDERVAGRGAGVVERAEDRVVVGIDLAVKREVAVVGVLHDHVVGGQRQGVGAGLPLAVWPERQGAVEGEREQVLLVAEISGYGGRRRAGQALARPV